tara:strand:- start:381 stop:1958 length:1578 start_codon:yes stop_codon:yes gene_type:complete
MKARPYQIEATRACIEDLKQGYNPVLNLATGTGKSLIIAHLAYTLSRQNKRVWILTHTTKLVQQNVAQFKRLSALPVGICCSSIHKPTEQDINEKIIYGTIQTISNLSILAADVIIIDEAHRVPFENGKSQYEKLFTAYPQSQKIALTATPWRLDNKLIYKENDNVRNSNDGDLHDSYGSRWFNKCSYEYNVAQGVKEGYLSPLVGASSRIQLDLSDCELIGNDFNQADASRLITDSWLTSVCKKLNTVARDRKIMAVYTPTILVAMTVKKKLEKYTDRKVAVLHSKMDQDERQEIYQGLEDGRYNTVTSVDMLTTGFNLPSLDCIVCLRPTLSSSLWVQILGRGTRLSDGKKNCLVLDFVGNFLRLGGCAMMPQWTMEKRPTIPDEIVEGNFIPLPFVKKERFLHPGLTTIEPVDPSTGKAVGDNDTVAATVSACQGFVPRGKNYISVKYVCLTENNAKITATRFLNTNKESDDVYQFFDRRNLPVTLPCQPNRLSYMIKMAAKPLSVILKKNGRYWNVLEETF